MGSGKALYDRLERWVDPVGPEDAAALEALDRFCAEALPDSRAGELEARSEFPAAELACFMRGPLGLELIPAPEGGRMDWARAGRITSRLSAHDVGFALCLGGTVLGSLPVIVAGTPAQRADFFRCVRDGGMAGLGLSEWTHGSDLVASEALAEPLDDAGNACDPAAATRFRLTGVKSPINNGSVGARVVVLARVAALPENDAFSLALFVIPRDTPGLLPHPKVPWQGFPGMDLSGIRLEGAVVPRSALLGAVGEGFAHTRRTLEISRSGVAAQALGPAACALALAVEHARSRVLYGAPISRLGGVESLLGRAAARMIAAIAVTRRAARSVGRWAISARAWSSAAKLISPALSEQVVADAATILGARSLFAEHPFARVRRNAYTFAIFDGSSQLQLDELWRHALPWAAPGTLSSERALEILAALRAPGPTDFDPMAQDQGELKSTTPPAMLAALVPSVPELDLGPFARVAAALSDAGGAIRGAPQEVRFVYASAAGRLYAFSALAEAVAVASEESRPLLGAALTAFAGEEIGSLISEIEQLSGAEVPVGEHAAALAPLARGAAGARVALARTLTR